MAIKILDVGQCGFDGPQMAALWQKELGANVEQCDTGAQAKERLKQTHYDLVLVNRVLAADGGSGLEVIKNLLHVKSPTPVMLVSDHANAQDKAVAMGAVRGFGKSDLEEQSTLDWVRKVASGTHAK